MVPTDFPESNHVLGKPQGMTHEQCDPLSVFIGKDVNGLPVTISCWKLTQEEIDHLLKGHCLWIYIIGDGMPPILPTTVYPFH